VTFHCETYALLQNLDVQRRILNPDIVARRINLYLFFDGPIGLQFDAQERFALDLRSQRCIRWKVSLLSNDDFHVADRDRRCCKSVLTRANRFTVDRDLCPCDRGRLRRDFHTDRRLRRLPKGSRPR
jgi:hypothetical protein